MAGVSLVQVLVPLKSCREEEAEAQTSSHCTVVLERVYKSGDGETVHSWSSGDCGAPLPPPMGSSQAIRSIPEERLQFQWRRRWSHSSPKGVTQRDGGARASPPVGPVRFHERVIQKNSG
ncbi:hypothetical protein TNCV_3614441 [Trichonephila clavipes]|uniref:Uncharacterized protein n=1 Tax=Trichonephila clavipes TaxID=2585209 RepID=A0A8X6VP80_TRICX|nr:hypothetical protein TNCV_3614441 [Trichonephila clavipes]